MGRDEIDDIIVFFLKETHQRREKFQIVSFGLITHWHVTGKDETN